MSEILWITGASGFTGRHLVGFVRAEAPALRTIGVDVQPVACAGPDVSYVIDLTDAGAIAALASSEPPTWVIHLAGLMPPAAEPDMWRANVGGTIGLLVGLRAAGCRGTRVVSIGSAAEYALDAASPIAEGAPCGGASPYGNSKLAQSLTCLRLAADCGVDAIVARSFNLIGPGLPPRLVVGALVGQFAAAADSIRVGNTHTARDFVDVRDAVRAYWLLAERAEGTIYNVCSGTATSVGELLTLLRRLSGRSPSIEVDLSLVRTSDPVAVVGSSRRLYQATGWRPEIALEQSLRDMLGQV